MRTRSLRAFRVLVGSAFVLVVAMMVWTARSHPPVSVHKARPAPSTGPRPSQGLVPDPIDGQLAPYQLAARRPIAVIIDNFTQARPQWGLSAASRVYEAITEGGITRYLAVFAEKDADRIGPVRSVRTQFLDYALEIDAGVAHVGGNADALALIQHLPIMNLDEFRYAGAFRRIPAPHVAFEHTVFTSTAALRGVIDQRVGVEGIAVAPERWKDDAAAARRPAAGSVSIAFSLPEYAVRWTYEPAANDYARTLGGVPDTDAATGQVLTAKSIAIAVVSRTHGRTVIGEDTWTFADIGSGPAWVLQDGVVVPGTWRKQTRADRLRFFDGAGREIAFDRGPQWVEVIPPEVSPTFSP
jgi:hypothetical protein